MDKFDVVENWIANVQYSHSKSESTAERYRRELKTFVNFIAKTPEQILEEYENLDYRKFQRKYAQYLRALIAKKTNEGFAPNTVYSLVTAVKSFFKYNDLPLGHTPIGRNRVIFHNRDISREEIAQILAISRPRDKAFFCMMAQGGLRPNILVNLKYKHIQEDFENEVIPMKIFVPSEIAKSKYGSFFTFVGEESVKYLEAYLATKPQIKPDDYLFTGYGIEKKLNTKSISQIFMRAVRKLEKKGIIKIKDRQHRKPAEVRLYNLRKFFRKYAGQAGIEFVNFWMGHKTNYKAPHIPSSDEHYFDKSDVEWHRKLYAEKAMPHLRIEMPTLTETEQRIEELKEQLKQKDKLIQEQEKRLRSLEEFQKDTLERIHELAEWTREIKEFRNEMKFYREGNISVVYHKDTFSSEDELREVVEEARERRKKERK